MADTHHHTLHLTHLEPFKQWLVDNGVPFRPGKGPYQVLQVFVEGGGKGWAVIFRKEEMPEHYTVNRKLMPLVRQFIAERKRNHAQH